MARPKSTTSTANGDGKRRVLFWTRTDLRTHDAPALRAALGLTTDPKEVTDKEQWDEAGIECFYPVWCWDPQYVWKHKVGVNRWQFLLQSMQNLSDNLNAIDPAQKLLVLRGSPQQVLPLVWSQWKITDMCIEKDTAAYARQRDQAIIELAKEVAPELKVHVLMGHNLLDPEEVVIKGNKGQPTTTLGQWQKAASVCGAIRRPLPPPTSLPPPGDTALEADTKTRKSGEDDGMSGPFAKLEGENLNKEIMDAKRFSAYAALAGPDGQYSVPTMDELGLTEPATTHIHGGETEGRKRLEAFLGDPSRVATFSKPATAPTALEPSTTLLSPYIKFGCVSVRELYWRSRDVSESYKAKGGEKKTKEPENMAGQLEFREMYYCAEFGTEHFGRIQGNKICRFINWSLRNQYDDKGELILPRPRGSDKDEEMFLAYKEGRTGFPWIDAVMRQLKSEGWIHHLARHSVACFLTRGQCYISWERGAEVFDEYLLDWDPCSNPGNWMWLSCSAFFSQYYRVYGLASWPAKTDKKGVFVRKYCPELKDMPDKYIYEPHLAPESVQKSAKCIIGKDYPAPMLDEKREKARCIARLKAAYAVGLHGDAAKVLDGSAEAIVREQEPEEEDGEDEDKKPRGKKRAVETGPMDAHVKRTSRGKK